MLLLLQQIEGSSLFKSKLLRKFASFEFHIATGFLYNFWWVSKLFSSIYSKLIQIVVTTKCNSMYDRCWFFLCNYFFLVKTVKDWTVISKFYCKRVDNENTLLKMEPARHQITFYSENWMKYHQWYLVAPVAMPATRQHQVFRKVRESAHSFVIFLRGGT